MKTSVWVFKERLGVLGVFFTESNIDNFPLISKFLIKVSTFFQIFFTIIDKIIFNQNGNLTPISYLPIILFLFQVKFYGQKYIRTFVFFFFVFFNNFHVYFILSFSKHFYKSRQSSRTVFKGFKYQKAQAENVMFSSGL